jgi:hypothetical protein
MLGLSILAIYVPMMEHALVCVETLAMMTRSPVKLMHRVRIIRDRILV